MLHTLSPLLYILYVKLIRKIKPIPNNNTLKYIRKIHNINLSFLSFFIILFMIKANYQENKFYPIYNLLCKSYNNNYYSNIGSNIFLYSKYLEWLDSLFIHLSNKSISNLHYTHHMSTAFLMYYNMNEYVGGAAFIPIGLNCFVHILMYYYFAYPYGFMIKFRKLITQIQIIQHFIVLLSSIYITNLDNCKQNKYGTELCIILYSMYIIYFSNFYFNTYIKINKKLNKV